jgi:hypothetical protein
MGLDQRVRAYKRSARNSFYRYPELYGRAGITNWRMIIARHFKISIAEVRQILER